MIHTNNHKNYVGLVYFEDVTMSYDNILKTLLSRPVNGPHLALGLRRPGEKTGVWLFGEAHDEYINTDGGVDLDVLLVQNLVQNNNDMVLFIESGSPPGKAIFKDAPVDVMRLHKVLFPVDDDDDDDDDYSVDDFDEDGNRNLKERDAEAYLDPEFWASLRENYLTYVGEKLVSAGGKVINIDNKIRHMFNTLVYDIPNNGTRMKKISEVLKILSWALAESVESTTQPKGGPVDRRDFTTPGAHEFYENLLRSVNERFHGFYSDGFLLKILPHVKAFLNDDPKTKLPYMADGSNLYLNHSYVIQFSSLLSLLMMDMNLPIRMKNYPGMNFVFYGGAAHCINQYIALVQKGYVLEHTFNNPDYGYVMPTHYKPKGWLSYDPNELVLKEYTRMDMVLKELEDKYKNFCTWK